MNKEREGQLAGFLVSFGESYSTFRRRFKISKFPVAAITIDAAKRTIQSDASTECLFAFSTGLEALQKEKEKKKKNKEFHTTTPFCQNRQKMFLPMAVWILMKMSQYWRRREKAVGSAEPAYFKPTEKHPPARMYKYACFWASSSGRRIVANGFLLGVRLIVGHMVWVDVWVQGRRRLLPCFRDVGWHMAFDPTLAWGDLAPHDNTPTDNPGGVQIFVSTNKWKLSDKNNRKEKGACLENRNSGFT